MILRSFFFQTIKKDFEQVRIKDKYLLRNLYLFFSKKKVPYVIIRHLIGLISFGLDCLKQQPNIGSHHTTKKKPV